MKCDELKPVFVDMSGNIVANELGELYYKPEVDAAIEELKKKLEDVRASMYADVVDANMENRRLKRALWLDRARNADSMYRIFYFVPPSYLGEPLNILGYSNTTKGGQRMLTADKWKKILLKVWRKCLKKAEEYK